MIKAIVFDLDDTLYPEHKFVLSGFQAVNEWVSHYYNTPGFFELAKRFFEEGHRGNIFNLTLDSLGIKYDFNVIQKLLQVYREHKPSISLHEDVKWAIYYFRQSKQLGIITDGYFTTQKNKVVSLGIEEYFDVIVYSDQYGKECWKPSPFPYLKIMEELGRQGNECMYVGDNPCKDFVTAKVLGWSTVQICRERGEYYSITVTKSYEADFRIPDLYYLKEIIKASSFCG